MSTLKEMNEGKRVSAQRIFTRKNYNEQVGMFIKDEYGNGRINIYIDENNEPKFQILDKDGKVVKQMMNFIKSAEISQEKLKRGMPEID